MKTRQFKRLAGLPRRNRDPLVVEGLTELAANVARLAEEIERCNKAHAFGGARLAYNAGREEAGKFLVLVDAYRAPDASQAASSRQFARAGNHLAKLIYAQIADYSIATYEELLGAVDQHRQALHLDGPNDYDWVFRNDLIAEREGALYVDLVDSEGTLRWWKPTDLGIPLSVPRSMHLVMAISDTGLISLAGLDALRSAWAGFDPKTESHCSDWTERTKRALEVFPGENIVDGTWRNEPWFVADRWPMPMVTIDVEELPVTERELVAKREARFEAEMRREYGWEDDFDR